MAMDRDALKRAILAKQLKARLAARQPDEQNMTLPYADRQQPLPLSFAQQSLWFLTELDSAVSEAYNMPCGLRIQGPLDVDAFITALDRVVARHESLRTRFVEINDQPCQQIESPECGFALQQHDLRELDASSQAARVEALREREAQAPFDLAKGPPLRGQLLQLADDDHLLLLTVHHIVFDGWSIGVLVQELAAFYNAASQGKEAALPELARHYVDYVAWQRQTARTAAFDTHRAFWRQQLEGAPALLELPLDRPRPTAQDYAGDQVPVAIDSACVEALKVLSQRHGATLFMTLFAAWSLVLARLSGQDDVVIGTPVANRQHPEFEGLIGFFVNTLALRLRFDEHASVTDLLAQARTCLLEAQAHQELPFEQVVDALQPERSLSYSPVVQAVMALNNTPVPSHAFDGLSLSFMASSAQRARLDLSLSLTEDEHGIRGALEYAVALFDRATIERMPTYFRQVLDAMLADDTQPLSQLSILPEASRQQILHDFNAPQTVFSPEPLIHQAIEQWARETPDATALTFEDTSLSYAEMNLRANRLAHRLIAMGVTPNTVVAICVERSLDTVIGTLAILKAGGAYLPLDPVHPQARLTYMLEDARPRVLVTQRGLAERFDSDCPLLVLDAVNEDAAGQPTHNPTPALAAHHLAYVIYTSGSTGQPKGVMIEHGQISRLRKATADYFTFDQHDVWTQFHSFAFDFSVWELWTPLCYGARLVIVSAECARSPQAFHALLCREQVTVLNQTPSAFQGLTAVQDATPHALRVVIFCGEALEFHALAPWIARNPLAQTRLVNMYGVTEIAVLNTFHDVSEADIAAGRSSLIGRAFPDIRTYLLDAHGQPVAIGALGEMYFAGAGVARGYLNRPELTAERFLPDPFSDEPDAKMYRTGDLARWHTDGTLEYKGRNDFQVKLRGFRIELGEIEARLAQHENVRDVAVIAREDVSGDKRLVAYLTVVDGAAPSPAALREHLRQALSDYMVPSAFVVLEAFPLTANGKLDRRALPAPDTASVTTRDYVAPQGEIETRLASLWMALLDVERVGRLDNFFDLGGHSLMAVKLLARMRQQQMTVSLATLFAQPTLQGLAQAVAMPQAPQCTVFEANPMPMRPEGHLTPLFLVHEPSGDTLVYTELASLLPKALPIYALQALGMHALATPPKSIDALAACHVEAIQRQQPHGPYRLAGWSLGGVIAYEIAQQLRRQGESVEFVGMIDAYHPETMYAAGMAKPHMGERERIGVLCLFLRVIVGVTDTAVSEALHGFDTLDTAIQHSQEEGWLPVEITPDEIRARIATLEILNGMLPDYETPRSEQAIQLFYAEPMQNDPDGWHGWKALVGEASQCHRIGGTHETIMQPPFLQRVAEVISKQLVPAKDTVML